MFATDRDLLVLEPRLFFDVAWTTQTLLNTSGAEIDASGTALSAPGAGFDSLGIGTGHVALVAGVPVEVVERTGADDLVVSRLRPSAQAPAIPASPGAGLQVSIATFAPQIGLVHAQLVRMLGVEPGDESRITNQSDLALAEALGALHLVFAGASVLIGERSREWTKAEMYRRRFDAERRRVVAQLDLDDDGAPDATRRPSAMQFLRA